MQNEIYFETLGAALESAFAQFEKKGAVVVGGIVAMGEAFNGGVAYGQTVSRSFELATLKGKATRKGAHVTLYRMESGRYELTSYIL